MLAFYGDTIKPAAWSLCWTVMALTVNIAQAVGVGALLLRMLPFWIPRVSPSCKHCHVSRPVATHQLVAQLYGHLIQLVVLQVAADGLTFGLLSSTGCFLWLLMTKVLIPWAHGCWLAFFHKAAQPQAPSPPCCANDNDLHLEVHVRTLTLCGCSTIADMTGSVKLCLALCELETDVNLKCRA